ncbi:MAG: hypothetical protein OER95_19635 [Acidimicrobiia bacterium]|nr:hypothetical protein [Acidimicrobiia bacterium]
MNLFRSEEDVRHWSQFDPATSEGILPLDELVELFSVDHFTRRLETDYIASGLHGNTLIAAVTELAKTKPYWSP